jgi:cytochrome P450
LITAGDAAAVALAWMLDTLGRSSGAQALLRAEIGASGDGPDPAALGRLPFLTAVSQEVLRLHTILPTVSGRRLMETTEIMGFPIPAGATVAPCEYLVHRRADLYPEPLRFRPERFLGRQYGPHEYFPFGGGGRSCLGGALAPLEMKLAAATLVTTLVKQAHLAPADPEPVATVRFGTLLAPAETSGFIMTD